MAAILPNPTRVVMIDDTAVIAHLLARELDRQFDIQLVGTASNISKASQRIRELKPDVIVLDIEMPGANNGFLSELLKIAPVPVILLASSTPDGSNGAMQALTAGAVDVVSKPTKEHSIEYVVASLIEKIRSARGRKPLPMVLNGKLHSESVAECPMDTILAIGAGSGGLGSLSEVLAHLPANAPGAVVVHHLPAGMTGLLAQRLSEICEIQVKEAATGDAVIPGRALIAPGGQHMLLRRSISGYFVHLKDGPEVFHQKPSVDVLFNSVAKHAGVHAVGAILNGVQSDGAQGLLSIRRAGGHTLIADEQSTFGDAERIVPITQVASAMLEMASAALVH